MYILTRLTLNSLDTCSHCVCAVRALRPPLSANVGVVLAEFFILSLENETKMAGCSLFLVELLKFEVISTETVAHLVRLPSHIRK